MRFPRVHVCLLAAVALASAAQAQTVASRSTNVFGSFAVGYAVVNDSGSFNVAGGHD